MPRNKEAKSLHERKLELAKASAPKYGIYMDGGSVNKLCEAIQIIAPAISSVIDSDSEEKTKRMALDMLKNSIPSVNNCNFSNVNIDLGE